MIITTLPNGKMGVLTVFTGYGENERDALNAAHANMTLQAWQMGEIVSVSFLPVLDCYVKVQAIITARK